MSGLNAPQNPRSTVAVPSSSSLAPLSRLAGPLALAAGTLMIVVELVMFPIVDRDIAPQIVDADPSGLIVIGAVSSYLLFAIGWALFGLASLRAGVFPKAICIAIVVGGLLGFNALLPPWGIGLGLALVWLGVWMIRTPAEVVS